MKVNVQLSRRIAKVALISPLLELGPLERSRLGRLAEQANDFGDLPEYYQRLILEAEVNRERLIAQKAAKAG